MSLDYLNDGRCPDSLATSGPRDEAQTKNNKRMGLFHPRTVPGLFSIFPGCRVGFSFF